jgi:hypothetical protein
MNFRYINNLKLDDILPEEEQMKLIKDLQIISDQTDDLSVRFVTGKTNFKKFSKVKERKLNGFLKKTFK